MKAKIVFPNIITDMFPFCLKLKPRPVAVGRVRGGSGSPSPEAEPVACSSKGPWFF